MPVPRSTSCHCCGAPPAHPLHGTLGAPALFMRCSGSLWWTTRPLGRVVRPLPRDLSMVASCAFPRTGYRSGPFVGGQLMGWAHDTHTHIKNNRFCLMVWRRRVCRLVGEPKLFVALDCSLGVSVPTPLPKVVGSNPGLVGSTTLDHRVEWWDHGSDTHFPVKE